MVGQFTIYLLFLFCLSASHAWNCPPNSQKNNPNLPNDVAYCYCKPGYWGDLTVPGATCMQCPPNTTSTGMSLSSESCHCISFFFGDLQHGETCKPCPNGKFSRPGSRFVTNCTCLNGMDEYGDEFNVTTCLCPANTFRTETYLNMSGLLGGNPISDRGNTIELSLDKKYKNGYIIATTIDTRQLQGRGSGSYSTKYYLRAEDDLGVLDLWSASGSNVNLPRLLLPLPRDRGVGLKRLYLDSSPYQYWSFTGVGGSVSVLGSAVCLACPEGKYSLAGDSS
eukprot:763829-Hanusia_phi.AAC.1